MPGADSSPAVRCESGAWSDASRATNVTETAEAAGVDARRSAMKTAEAAEAAGWTPIGAP